MNLGTHGQQQDVPDTYLHSLDHGMQSYVPLDIHVLSGI